MHKKTFFLMIIPVLIILIPSALSVGLGVSPASLTFDNVLKGGYAQNGVYISTFASDNNTITFEKEGQIKDWIIIENNITNVTIGMNSPRYVKIMIEPPSDTANGNYSGDIIIRNEDVANPDTGIGSAVKAQFMMKIYVSVTGDQIKACSGGGLTISDAEIGFPLAISSIIKNEGNVRLSPPIFVEIWDKYQQNIVYSKTLTTQSILPTETFESIQDLNVDLPVDQYWATIKVPDCNVEGTQTFNIVEKGGISDKGELIRVENKPWASTDEIIPITAVFRNDGARVVTAKFKGEILFGDKVVKIIDTDSIDANPGEVVALQTFFKPGDQGQYFVRGKVYFNNKLTSEKASVINVNATTTNTNSSGKILIWTTLFLIITGILVMMILIKRKKHKIRKSK